MMSPVALSTPPSGSTVIAHNAAFDIAVLCGTLAFYGLTVPRLTYLCTRTMARRAWRRT